MYEFISWFISFQWMVSIIRLRNSSIVASPSHLCCHNWDAKLTTKSQSQVQWYLARVWVRLSCKEEIIQIVDDEFHLPSPWQFTIHSKQSTAWVLTANQREDSIHTGPTTFLTGNGLESAPEWYDMPHWCPALPTVSRSNFQMRAAASYTET